MKLFLIGLPGSGKSTIGKDLSKKLNYPLIDTDDVIRLKEGCSIEEIFSAKGESYFRKTESETLKELTKGTDAIISTGGGTPCFFDNMEVINQNGISLFLNIPLREIARRLIAGPQHARPLIKGKNPAEIQKFLEDKFNERIPFYSKATIEFIDPALNAEMIVKELEKRDLL
ncbi:MAG: shikimate kinase [Cytophagaceae bacterium]